MALSVKGKITQLLTEQSGTSKAGKEWKKQEFVIESDEQFPKSICFTLFGDKTALVAEVAIGDIVEVFFNLESREFNGKWYHNINAWRIEKMGANTNTTGDNTAPFPSYSENDIPPEAAQGDDLPF
ncbi:MAG: DUF3127 domain-containing protein [Bacteroidales bacterium]